MSFMQKLIIGALTLCAGVAWAQTSTQKSQIGYLYPGGAQQGTTVLISAGGQFLKGADQVHVSGTGVRASVVEYMKPLRNLNKDQRALFQKRLKELRDKRLAELSRGTRTRSQTGRRRTKGKATPKPKPVQRKETPIPKGTKLPDHPLLHDLDKKSLRELAHVSATILASRRKKQVNRQISEFVLIEIKVDPDAEPGNRELRIRTGTGLTNPLVFQVGSLPEVRELEPNDKQAYPELPNLPKETKLPQTRPLALPVLLNGQVMPGDVDRFRFRARQGQSLVIETQARSLIPYLADAVPGWFQACLTLYNARGQEVAFADDYRFNPDPVLFYRIPISGEYELEIRDSIYRGREDFVYRIAVGEHSFITQVFPLGARQGARTTALVKGWNLAQTELPLDTQTESKGFQHTASGTGRQFCNAVPYAVDSLPECNENSANNTIEEAQTVYPPQIVNGRVECPGDVDVFQFRGLAGTQIVAEVHSRRLNSPLDSLLRLTDATGRVLAWNDDHVLKENHLHRDMMGLVTHHADSYVMAELPSSGTYYVHLADAQRHGGEAYGYRLRMSAPQPDFALRVTPSSLSMQAGSIVPITVHVLRKDGFKGEIEVALHDAPGFKLSGVRIPADRERVRMTLTAQDKQGNEPFVLELEGRAEIRGKTVIRPAIPADDTMQAFLYRHLVPSQELVVAVKKARWRQPTVKLDGPSPVRVPLGGTARVQIKTRRGKTLKEMRLELNEAPEGLTLHDLTVLPDGLAFLLRADKEAIAQGFADNLIVEAFREYTPKAKDGKPVQKRRRYSMGIMPAIPIEVVAY
jgi:hypothetical protein